MIKMKELRISICGKISASWRILCVFIMVINILSMQGQVANGNTRAITGIVLDEKGESIIGANIMETGTSKGTITDIDGKFRLTIGTNSSITVSYIGYISTTLRINDNGVIKITLNTDSKNLEEVVVVGYGTVNKRSFSGSVATVKAEDLTAIKTLSPTQALQGRASGVNVTTSSGTPGAPSKINIRGISTINADTDPLWIIDGLPMYSGRGLEASTSSVSQDPMSLINPNDIESMEVLKDAAATSIYGSRGSNGVIIITTKSGKKLDQKVNINIDYTVGYSDLTRTPKQVGYANTEQWIALADQAKRNTGSYNAFPTAVFNPDDATAATPFVGLITREQALQTNTNWFDQV